jgi:hypothetical protein
VEAGLGVIVGWNGGCLGEGMIMMDRGGVWKWKWMRMSVNRAGSARQDEVNTMMEAEEKKSIIRGGYGYRF